MQSCFQALTLLRCIVPGRWPWTPTSARSARGALAGVVQQSSRRLAVASFAILEGCVCSRRKLQKREAELQGARTDHTVLLTAISTSVLANVHVSGCLCAARSCRSGKPNCRALFGQSQAEEHRHFQPRTRSDLYVTVCSGSGRSCRSGRRSCRAPRRTARQRSRNGRLRSGSSSRCRARRGASPRT